MNDTLKNWVDALAAGFAVAANVVDHVVSIVAGLMAITWYIYRYLADRKSRKNGNVK